MRTMESNGFAVFDYRDGSFPEKPADQPTDDYNSIIESVKTFKTQMDFLRLFNQTGIVAVVEKWYVDEDAYEPYDYKIAYSMFGTHITDVNSDNYPTDGDTGVYDWEGAVLWNNADCPADIIVMDQSRYNEADYNEHLRKFYTANLTKPNVTKA